MLNPARLRRDFVEAFELHIDGARALRACAAFTLPLAVGHFLHRPTDALFVSVAALNLSNPDLRGSYHIRVAILAAMTLVASAAAFVGVVSSNSLGACVAAMGALALLGGVWRHLSADYGPATSVSSTLLFLIATAHPGPASLGLHTACLTALGGAVATLFHALYWLVRPQHALRNAVAETWVAVSDMVAAMRAELGKPAVSGMAQSLAREGDVRASLDTTFHVLRDAQHPRQAKLLAHLEQVRHEAVQVSMNTVALRSSIEVLSTRPEFARCLPAVDSVLKALSDAARSVGLTLIMHRDADFAATALRLKRCQHLIQAAVEQVGAASPDSVEAAQVSAVLEQLSEQLTRTQVVVRETTGHSTRSLGFLPGLADMGALPLRSLGAWIRPSSRLDPLLVRHAIRLAVLTMLAMAIYKGMEVPRGYWIALTVLVVLQPDFGSTRKRAGARIIGTVGGMVVASLLLWIRLPLAVVDALAVMTAFLFSLHLRLRYRVAVFFVTVNLVLVTELNATVSWDFLFLRIFSTLLGGGMALLAALFFWPVWEREQFSTLLAAAIEANRLFLRSLEGAPGSAQPLIAKRKAENANRTLAASLERMLGEPAAQREFPERSAALTLYTQRMTRALTALALRPEDVSQADDPLVRAIVRRLDELLGDLSEAAKPGASHELIDRIEARLSFAEATLSGGLSGASASSGRASDVALTALSKVLSEARATALAVQMST